MPDEVRKSFPRISGQHLLTLAAKLNAALDATCFAAFRQFCESPPSKDKDPYPAQGKDSECCFIMHTDGTLLSSVLNEVRRTPPQRSYFFFPFMGLDTKDSVRLAPRYNDAIVHWANVWSNSPSRSCLVFLQSLPGIPGGKLSDYMAVACRLLLRKEDVRVVLEPAQRTLIAGELLKNARKGIQDVLVGRVVGLANLPYPLHTHGQGESVVLELMLVALFEALPQDNDDDEADGVEAHARMLRRAFFNFVHPNMYAFPQLAGQLAGVLHRLYEHPPEVSLAIQVAELACLNEVIARSPAGYANLVCAQFAERLRDIRTMLNELPPSATLFSRCELLLVCLLRAEHDADSSDQAWRHDLISDQDFARIVPRHATADDCLPAVRRMALHLMLRQPRLKLSPAKLLSLDGIASDVALDFVGACTPDSKEDERALVDAVSYVLLERGLHRSLARFSDILFMFDALAKVRPCAIYYVSGLADSYNVRIEFHCERMMADIERVLKALDESKHGDGVAEARYMMALAGMVVSHSANATLRIKTAARLDRLARSLMRQADGIALMGSATAFQVIALICVVAETALMLADGAMEPRLLVRDVHAWLGAIVGSTVSPALVRAVAALHVNQLYLAGVGSREVDEPVVVAGPEAVPAHARFLETARMLLKTHRRMALASAAELRVVFERLPRVPTVACLERANATKWMAFSQQVLAEGLMSRVRRFRVPIRVMLDALCGVAKDVELSARPLETGLAVGRWCSLVRSNTPMAVSQEFSYWALYRALVSLATI